MTGQSSIAVPSYSALFQPVLDALRGLGGSGRAAEVRDLVASKLGLTDSTLEQTLASGESVFTNRVQWARFYLVKTGYIDSSKRGVWTLTEKGTTARIDSDTQKEIERDVKRIVADRPKKQREAESVPAESQETYTTEGDHRAALLELLYGLPPSGFERLCQRLLRESGFEQVVVTGKSGDGGIDGHGVLQVNPFVSFKVLFQCKRYRGGVATSAVRDFRGAMMGRADKGLILTTGTFSPDARREAVRDGVPPIELVDGEDLVDLFESLELGLRPRKAFDVDEAFFAEFQLD